MHFSRILPLLKAAIEALSELTLTGSIYPGRGSSVNTMDPLKLRGSGSRASMYISNQGSEGEDIKGCTYASWKFKYTYILSFRYIPGRWKTS